MIPRYTRREMGAVWTDKNKFQQWLEVELAATETLADLGVVPREDAVLLRRYASFDVPRIFEIEKETRLARKGKRGAPVVRVFGDAATRRPRGQGKGIILGLFARRHGLRRRIQIFHCRNNHAGAPIQTTPGLPERASPAS